MCGCTAALLGLEGVDIERVESLAQGYVVKVRLRRRRDADPVEGRFIGTVGAAELRAPAVPLEGVWPHRQPAGRRIGRSGGA